MRVALGINAVRTPQIRDAILARTLHRATCACGETVHAVGAFEYADLDHGQLVIVALPAELSQWPTLEARLRSTVRRLFEHGSPHAHDLGTRLRSRVVFGDDELREKLVIWVAALDDGLVECVKIRAFASDPALAAPGSRLTVVEIDADDNLACVWSALAEPPRALNLPGNWVRDAVRDRASLVGRYPELFEHGFVSARRFFSRVGAES